MIITHNLSAMQTNRHLNLNNTRVSKSLEKLSSGYRINVGADDPSGLIISEQLRSQISGVNRAIQNTSEASNLIGLTEGALTEMNEILKKMRALAIHAANSGVTSPEQVKADQAEVDSGIATIQRIADTTRYSDQFVLNGSKQLVYDRTTQVKTTMDHTLIDVEGSRVDQIFKRSGVSMSFSYSGLDADGYVNNANQAKRAYFEVDSVMPDPHNPGAYIRSDADVTTEGVLTADQEFVLSGTKGTKLFKFPAGRTLGDMAQSINNSKDSLGVGATLTFSADATVDLTANGSYPIGYTDWSGTNAFNWVMSSATDTDGDPTTPLDVTGGFQTAGGNILQTSAAETVWALDWGTAQITAGAGVTADSGVNKLQVQTPADASITLDGTPTNAEALSKLLGMTIPDPIAPNNALTAANDMTLSFAKSGGGPGWTLSATLGGKTFTVEGLLDNASSYTFTAADGSGELAGLTVHFGGELDFALSDDTNGPFVATIPAASMNFASVDRTTTSGNVVLQPLSTPITISGGLVNPNDLAHRLGVIAATPNQTPVTGTAVNDIHFTLVQPLKEGDTWVLSVGTSPGANDLADLTVRPDSNQKIEFSTGPLAGLTLDLGSFAARDPANTEPYTMTLSAADIVFSNSTPGAYTERAVVNDHRQKGEVQIYGANINGGDENMKVKGVNIRNADDFRVGNNTDGDGRVFAKVTKFVNDQDYEVEWYKDEACTMLIGSSPKPNIFSATNNSGISNGGLTIALTNNAEVGDVYTIALIGQEFTLARDSDGVGGLDQPADFNVQGIGGWQGMSESSLANAVMSGVKLGYNTSETGDLFFKCEGPPEARVISVYTSADFDPDNMVATGTANLSAGGQRVIRLEAVNDSGFNMTIPFADAVTSGGIETGQVSFTNVALRLYATDYGSEEYVNIQSKSGTLFHYYKDNDTIDRTYVQSGTTVRTYGQDAILTLNGFPIRADGVVANVTTSEFMGKIALNAGVLGLTTVATAGYDIGSLISRAGTMQGVDEDEKLMRSIALSQGISIQPPRTLVGGKDGIIDGLGANGVSNSGTLQFDFSKIDTSVLNDTQLANLEAAMANGVNVEYAAGSSPTDNIKIAIHFKDKDGQVISLDLSSGTVTVPNPPAVTTPVPASSMGDIAFTALNSADGFAIPVDAANASTDYDFLAGLIIKGNSLDNSSGISSAPRTVYGLEASVDVPSFSAFTEVVTYATQARHGTTETLDNFIGGMQFQLGGNEGDQDRTVYSIPSMVMANLGRIEINGRIYTLQDVLGSSDASLIADPILAMQIIAQAVDDVSTLRGRLGAFQANTLETNKNSLTIAVEMLSKTESAIRDVDMASESTEFTKNQILVQAGTAMLAQANQISQNVLQLLG